ncbi:MAG: hypothetical protein J6J11_04200 [Treponema sp.]|nr:hypothetical protein [Treponema sp.]
MTSSQKISLSLLIAVLFFSVFSVLTLSGQFDFIEAKFYQPTVKRPIEKKLENLYVQKKQYDSILIGRFETFLKEKSIDSFTQSKPSDEQVLERTSVFAQFLAVSPYLIGVRIVENDGKRIHFSTFELDKKKQDNKKILYEDYNKLFEQGNVSSFENIKCLTETKYKIYSDPIKNQILYSFPLIGLDDFGAKNVKCTAIFYCESNDFIRYLFSKNLITLAEKNSAEYLVDSKTNKGCYIFGLPYGSLDFSNASLNVLKQSILEKINNINIAESDDISEENFTLSGNYKITEEDTVIDNVKNPIDDNVYVSDFNENGKVSEKTLSKSYEWSLFTKKVDSNFYISLINDARIFEVNTSLRVLVLVLIFVTIFLIMFLFFNFKHDDMVVIEDRIKRFQLAFITEYVNAKEISDENTNLLSDNIIERKKQLNEEIRKSLGRRGKKHSQKVNNLLEKNWSEILSVLGVSQKNVLANPKLSIDNSQLKSILEEILKNGNIKIQSTYIEDKSDATQSVSETKKFAENIHIASESVEELEEVSEAEVVEELEEIPEVESVEELEEVSESEVVEELEEVSEVESVEELEEVSEAEVVEEVEEVSEAESVEELEEVSESEVVEELEEVSEAEVVEELEEIPEVESVEELEEVSEAESVEELEEVSEVESVEELEEIPEAEPVEEVEEIPEAESVEELEEIPEAESVEELEEVSEANNEKVVSILDEIENTDVSEFIDDFETPENDIEYDDIDSEPMEFSSVNNFKANNEVNEIVENFSISSMDFSALDEIELNRDDLTGIESDNSEIIDNENTEIISAPSNVEKIFNEDDEIQMDENLDSLQDNDTQYESLEIKKEFSENKEQYLNAVVDSSENIAIEENSINSEKENESNIKNVEMLNNSNDSLPFLFTSFAANNNNITDLESSVPDAIILDTDGTYHIDGMPSETEIEIDADFKKLVDSVLK